VIVERLGVVVTGVLLGLNRSSQQCLLKECTGWNGRMTAQALGKGGTRLSSRRSERSERLSGDSRVRASQPFWGVLAGS
jgi:hypothetical protein